MFPQFTLSYSIIFEPTGQQHLLFPSNKHMSLLLNAGTSNTVVFLLASLKRTKQAFPPKNSSHVHRHVHHKRGQAAHGRMARWRVGMPRPCSWRPPASWTRQVFFASTRRVRTGGNRGHYFDGFWGVSKSEMGWTCFPLTHH